VLLKSLLRQRDVKGNTPLHLAAMLGSPHIGDLLLVHYERPELVLKNEEGQTPFHLAARYGHRALVEQLLQVDKVTDQIFLLTAKAGGFCHRFSC
jgi:ankyrin repeat protein